MGGGTLKEWVLDALERKLAGDAKAYEVLLPQMKAMASKIQQRSGAAEIQIKDAPKPTSEESARIIAEGQKRLEEKRKAVQAAVPEMKRAVEMTDRVLLAFREKYGREPKSAEELALFGKRGW
jgi:hypothetical protein